MLAFFFLLGTVQSQICDSGWTEYNGDCYKHFDTPNDRLNITGVRAKCASLGGDIAVGATRGEREFMERMNRPSFNGNFIFMGPYADQMVIGITQDIYNEWHSAVPGDPVIDKYLPWCGPDVNQKEPNQWGCMEHCIMHHSFANNEFCYHDIMCQGGGANANNVPFYTGFRRYMCKRSKKSSTICRDENAVAQGNRCVCKEGYIDIRDSDALDRRNYREGEKCVLKDPCRSLQNSLSMIFIIDASQSIQKRNWPSLVDFLKSGARLIPNTVKVGFIKFATEVTFADWLPKDWTRREFEQTVPTEYDAGYTNTPAAIDKAIDMFLADRSSKQVAVLITDGLPVIDENTDKMKGLGDTQAAIDQLRRNRVDIVALGYGPELQNSQGASYIKKWLEDPREDYFSFDKEACDLRSVHMQILLQKVCRRYV